MTHKSNVFFLEQDSIITRQKLEQIKNKGRSRIPVFNKTHNKVVGILYAKDLVNIDPDKKLKIKSIMRKKVQVIKDETRLDQVLNLFKKNKIHIFIVKKKFKITGIVTLENVLEEIVGEISDEFDLTRELQRVQK